MQFVVVTIEKLKANGHVVEATDIPGLWRVDGGPEITTNQLHSLADGLAFPVRFAGPTIHTDNMS